jgi:uridylate kinase
MSIVVISIGGSILAPEKLDPNFISSLSELLKKLTTENKIFIVVGGGVLARKYINIARDMGANEIELDEIGIAATRMNARLLIAGLGDFACPEPIESYDEALIQAKQFPIVIMGGTDPGHTTDAVAMMLAEYINADKFVNATSVDGVYTADPKMDKNAKKLPKLTPGRLMEITMQGMHSHQAGPHIVIDPLAARIIKRSGIPAFVVDGRNLSDLENAINGKKFNGSIIEEA